MIAVGSTQLSSRSAGATQEDSREHTWAGRQYPANNPQPSKQITTKLRVLVRKKERQRKYTHRSYQSSSLSGV